MKLRISAIRDEHDADGANIEVAPGIRLDFFDCASTIVDVPAAESANAANPPVLPAIDPNDTQGNAERN